MRNTDEAPGRADGHPGRQSDFEGSPRADALARTRAAYERARRQLLAAEEAYARALLAFEQVQARLRLGTPPVHQRRYLCGHDDMEPLEREDGALLDLCPACRQALTARPPRYREVRSLLMPDAHASDARPPRLR